jgi:hypothetical protein
VFQRAFGRAPAASGAISARAQLIEQHGARRAACPAKLSMRPARPAIARAERLALPGENSLFFRHDELSDLIGFTIQLARR